MTIQRMAELDLSGKRVLVRQDLNVPVSAGKVTSAARIEAALPTIRQALAQGARLMLMSHLGRPTEGQPESEYSLAPVADYLSQALDQAVPLVTDWLAGVEVEPGQVILCENVRFNPGEKKNDAALAQRMAELCDVFVMDAFGTAHRAQASTEGVARYAPVVCAGPLLTGELDALQKALDNPQRPLLAIVGGSKVSTKLSVLESLLDKVDQLIVGGGIANTFIAAAGYAVGQSLYEVDLIAEAQRLRAKAREQGSRIPIPKDVVVAQQFSADAEPVVRAVDAVQADEMILDIGPLTRQEYAQIIHAAGSAIWNGPVGVFEFPAFAAGTRSVAEAMAESKAFSIAGGGDTLAAIDQFGVKDQISYISTGGGAFLEYVEGKTLPAVAVLDR